MANACADCGGVGYGSIDEEFGWRKGGPCSTCTTRFEKAQEGLPEEKKAKFGPPGVGVTPPKGESVAFVDGPPEDGSEEEFDPGVVDTGTEPGVAPTSIDEALASTAGESEE